MPVSIPKLLWPATFGLVVVIGSIGSAAPAPAQLRSAAPAPAAQAHGPTAASELEDHPRMEDALRSLQAAKAALQSAAHDFQGHRQKALEATSAAIEEIRLALAAAPG